MLLLWVWKKKMKEMENEWVDGGEKTFLLVICVGAKH